MNVFGRFGCAGTECLGGMICGSGLRAKRRGLSASILCGGAGVEACVRWILGEQRRKRGEG